MPRVSICVFTRNGMPYLSQALASLEQQTFQDFEVLVQDCQSSDGSLDELERYHDRAKQKVDIRSEPDNGIADAFNRCIRRSSGEYLALLEADNRYRPTHLQCTTAYLDARPETSIVVTSHAIIDASDRHLYDWQAPALDFFGVITQERSTPSGSSVKRVTALGDDIYYSTNPEFGHVPDFEFWTRMVLRQYRVDVLPVVTFETRLSDKSGSCDTDRYQEFCQTKARILDSLVGSMSVEDLRAAVANFGKAGIWLWGARAVYGMNGKPEMVAELLTAAGSFYPSYPGLAELKERARGGSRN
jgi:glycosyltransferase involved in cell wall biosynthesis